MSKLKVFSIVSLISLILTSAQAQTFTYGGEESEYKGIVWNSLATATWLDTTTDGPLWNEISGVLQRAKILNVRFSRTLEKRNLARLISVYKRYGINFDTDGAAAYLGIGNYKIESSCPIYLNVETGNIVDSQSNVIGYSGIIYSKQKDVNIHHNDGFAFKADALEIFQKEQRFVVHACGK